MLPSIPWYITLITVATSLFIVFAVWRIVAAGAERSGLEDAERRRVRLATAIFLGAWLGLAIVLAPAPESLLARDRFSLTPLIPLFAGLGITVTLLALAFWRPLRRAIAAASLPALVGVQVYRVIGFVFVLLLALGQLPAHFAVPAGWGDVAIGLAAPLVALALARGATGARAFGVAWNSVGLLDLVVAVGMGTGLLAPVLMPELGARVPPAAAMGIFPLFLVPAFAVPVSVVLHLVAMGRLLGSLFAIRYPLSAATGR